MRSSAGVGGLLRRTLSGRNCSYRRTFSKARTGLLLGVRRCDCTLILLSLVLPKVPNRTILRRVQGGKGLPIVILATGSDLSRGMRILADKTSSCVAGPFRVERILTEIRMRLHRGRRGRTRRRRALSFGSVMLGEGAFRIRVTKGVLPGVAGRRFTVLRLLLGGPGRIFDGRSVFRCT